MDRIELRGMSFQGRHGVRQAERDQPQEFKVDIDVEADLSQASRTDHLSDTVDYTKLRGIARTVIEGPPASLLEALAGRIADLALELPGVASVDLNGRYVYLGGRLKLRAVRHSADDRVAVSISTNQGRTFAPLWTAGTVGAADAVLSKPFER